MSKFRTIVKFKSRIVRRNLIFSNKNMMYIIIALFILLGLLHYPLTVHAQSQFKISADTPVYAQILGKKRQVAELSAGFRFSAAQENFTQFQAITIQFGNEIASIERKSVRADIPVPINNEKTPKLNGYIITTKPTALYDRMGETPSKKAVLNPYLRYPFIDKLADPKGKFWYQILLAGQTLYIKEGDVQTDNGIPIIMYHHVLQDQENTKYRNTPTTVSTDALHFQFESINELGFETIQFDELKKYLQGHINLPAKVVILTFDDGLKSVYRYAYPLLKEFGFNATLFVITSRIQQTPQDWAPDTLQFLSVSEYQKMKDHADLQSHSHAMHHYQHFKPAAPQSDYQTLYIDLIRSKQELTALDSKPQYFAYPFGAYSDDYLNALKNTGFTLAVTTKWGKVKFGDDPMLLKRVYFTTDSSKQKIEETLEN